jgi:hypothetical protein
MRFLGFKVESCHDFKDDMGSVGGFGVHTAVGNINTAMFVGVGSIAKDFESGSLEKYFTLMRVVTFGIGDHLATYTSPAQQ